MMYVFEIQPTVSGSLFMFQSAYIVRSLKVRIVTELTKAPNFAQR